MNLHFLITTVSIQHRFLNVFVYGGYFWTPDKCACVVLNVYLFDYFIILNIINFVHLQQYLYHNSYEKIF